MQVILEVDLFFIITEWDIFDMMNGVSCLVPTFDITGSIGVLQLSKPIFVRHHVIGYSRVNKAYILYVEYECIMAVFTLSLWTSLV